MENPEIQVIWGERHRAKTKKAKVIQFLFLIRHRRVTDSHVGNREYKLIYVNGKIHCHLKNRYS